MHLSKDEEDVGALWEIAGEVGGEISSGTNIKLRNLGSGEFLHFNPKLYLSYRDE